MSPTDTTTGLVETKRRPLLLKKIAEDGRAGVRDRNRPDPLPLAERGVPVSGIELSPDMAAKLREKPGGETTPTHVGYMSEVEAEGEFSLVYPVYRYGLQSPLPRRAGGLLRERGVSSQ